MPHKTQYTGKANEFNQKLYDAALKRLMNVFDRGIHRMEYTRIKVCAGLLAHMNSDGHCFPSRNTLAKICRTSPNTVTSCLKELSEAGVIAISRHRNKERSRNFYHFQDVKWAKSMTWTGEDRAHSMNTENKPQNWVEFAFDWLERNVLRQHASRYAPQIRNACEQRGVDDMGTIALLNFSHLFPEVPFVRGMWMGVGNANVQTLIDLRAYDMEILRDAVEMRRAMLVAIGEEPIPPAHPLQLQSFLAQAVAKADARKTQSAAAEKNTRAVNESGYIGSSDLEF